VGGDVGQEAHWSDMPDHEDSQMEADQNSHASDDRTLILVDRTGVHRHHVRWCHCESSVGQEWQLFNMGLFPSTFKKPQTAFTFDVLDYFHIDSMECKTSANNFFTKLRRLTSNAFPDTVPVILSVWWQMDL
jgi:hypothetical protein